MARHRYTPEQRTAALELYREVGPSEAGRRLGIPGSLIRNWATRARVTWAAGSLAKEELLRDDVAGVSLITKNYGPRSTVTVEQIDAIAALRRAESLAMIEVSRSRQATRREQLRERMLDAAHDALDRMNEPHIEFKGKDAVKVEYPKAPAAAFQAYATSVAILLDKYRLEVGEPTSRSEVELRAQIEQVAVTLGLDPHEVWIEAERLAARDLDTVPD